MAKVGRPKKQINWDVVDRLCNIHCTGEEIASIMDVHYDTLNNHCNDEFGINFSEYYKKVAASGKMSLRRKQFETALDGNTSMLIWLGKNLLGQKDHPDGATDRRDININIVTPDA